MPPFFVRRRDAFQVYTGLDKPNGGKTMNRIFILCLCLVALVGAPLSASAQQECGSAERLYRADTATGVERACVDVVFVLDTTGSMAELIEGAKLKIWSVATEILRAEPRPRVRFGLVAYRDRGDAYVTRQVPLSADLDAVYAELLSFHAAGGGDTPESVNQALYEGVAEMRWDPSPHTLRLAFLVGDAPPQMHYRQDITYQDTLRLARQEDIVVNTLQAGAMPETTRVWQIIAEMGRGAFAMIPQSGGVQAVQTPYDQDIQGLQRALNETAIPYGDASVRESYVGKLAETTAMAPSATADRATAAYAESGMGLVFGGRDLLDVLADGSLKLVDVDRGSLPPEIRDLDDGDLAALVETRRKDRDDAKAEIARLTQARVEYLNARASDVEDSFDGEVKAMLRDQAALKGFTYGD